MAEWSEISEKDARQYYRIAPEILRPLALADSISFTVYAKKNNQIRPLNEGGKPDRSLLLKLSEAQEGVEVLIKRGDTKAYQDCLKGLFKTITDVLQEEIEQTGKHDAPVATQINYTLSQPRVTHVEELIGKGTAIGKRAPDFSLHDQNDQPVTASVLWGHGPLLLVFYPGDFSPVCTKQLCAYNDQFEEFTRLGLQVVGVSDNSVSSHKKFAETYRFSFPLLSDPNKRVAKLFDTTSLMMFGAVSRAVFVVSRGGVILYRYVEPTILTHRKPAELLAIVKDLAEANLLDPTKPKAS